MRRIFPTFALALWATAQRRSLASSGSKSRLPASGKLQQYGKSLLSRPLGKPGGVNQLRAERYRVNTRTHHVTTARPPLKMHFNKFTYAMRKILFRTDLIYSMVPLISAHHLSCQARLARRGDIFSKKIPPLNSRWKKEQERFSKKVSRQRLLL